MKIQKENKSFMKSLFELFPEKEDLKVLLICGALMTIFTGIILAEVRLPAFVISAPLFLMAMYYFIQGRPPQSEYCLYALATYMPFSKQLAFDAGDFPSPFVAAFTLCALILFSFLMSPEKRAVLKTKTRIQGPALGILVLGLISILNGIFFGKGRAVFVIYEFVRIWIIPFMIFLSVYHSLNSQKTAKNVIGIMILALFFVSLMSIYEFMTVGNVKFDKSRAGGIANDPNILAAFLNYMMMIALGFFLTYFKYKGGSIFSIPFLSGLRALMGTFSRGGYLCFAIGFTVVCFFRKKRLLILVLFAFLILFFNPHLLPTSIRKRMAQTIEKPLVVQGETVAVEEILDRSNRDRIEIWKGALAMIKKYPVFGVGYTRFVPTVAHYWYEQMPFEAHNTFLFIAGEMGIPAALFFIWLIAIFFIEAVQFRLHARDDFEMAFSSGMLGAMASLLPAHLHVIRLDSLEIAAYFWILIAMLMKLKAVSR